MIATAPMSHKVDAAYPTSPSTEGKPALDELGLMRAQCEYLSLAATAMSHEMRQGLHILLGHLKRCVASRHSISEKAELQAATILVNRITMDFESLAVLAALAGVQAQSPHLEPVAIRPILSQTYARWQSEARNKGVAIRMALNDVTVLSNERWLGIMLSNILGNAVRHSHVGEVSIEGQVESTDFILSIRDNGPGIGELEIRRVFEGIPPPRPNSHGLGLGLSIVRRAAELLRHDLGISSTPFRGTAVRLRIPIADGEVNRFPLLPHKYFDAT